MISLTTPDPLWITTDAALAAVCQTWLNEPFLALDTEFIRTDTFYPIAGLCQVADSQHCYLLDPLLIQDWQPLREVFQAPQVVKAFHACTEDLEVCKAMTGVYPEPLVDTQLAAALTGFGRSLGFQALLEALLDIHLAKEETRSDWLQRPLTSTQVQYAVADVYFLYKIYPLLMQRISSNARDEWLAEECQRLIQHAKDAESPSYYYSRLKQTWKLSAKKLYVLQQLSYWREEKARKLNIPRNKVVDSQSLWNIAYYGAATVDQLKRAGMKAGQCRLYQAELLSLLEQASQADKSVWPELAPKPLNLNASKCYKQLKQTVKQQADELAVPADLLAGKKVLEGMLRSGFPQGPYVLPDILQGWRKPIIGEMLLAQLNTSICEETEY